MIVLVWSGTLLIHASAAFLAKSATCRDAVGSGARTFFHPLSMVSSSSTKETSNWNQRQTDAAYGRQIAKQAIEKRLSRDQKEFSWLSSLHRSWENVPAGKMDAVVVKQFPTALSLYAKHGTLLAAQQSEEMLRRYVDEYIAENPAIATINMASIHATMNAYAKSGQPHLAQTVLRYMLEIASTHPARLGHLKPDVFSFTILATAWAKSRHAEAADKAEALLRYMEDQQMPITTLTYNVVLNAIAVSHDKNKATRAQAVVEKMTKKSQNKDKDSPSYAKCAPDIYTYQSWMAACSRTRGGLQQTLKILKFLDDQKNDSDDGDNDDDTEDASSQLLLRPNAHCFAAAIHAWAHANAEPDRAKQAYLLLQEMRKRHEELGQKECMPNVVVYTAAINACVNPCDKSECKKSFKIAQLVFEELVYSKYARPNFLSYAAFLRVCSSTLPLGSKQRDAVVKRAFNMSCKEGFVGKMVFQQFKEAASAELYKEVLADVNDWDDIPSSWRRRVQGERYDGPSSPTTVSKGDD